MIVKKTIEPGKFDAFYVVANIDELGLTKTGTVYYMGRYNDGTPDSGLTFIGRNNHLDHSELNEDCMFLFNFESVKTYPEPSDINVFFDDREYDLNEIMATARILSSLNLWELDAN